ncbi:MAG: hypothetical protein VYA54_01500 [Bdellovibrionota bacterium]|nr:hypothetical protein [Bdellovibrionota bacterium]
MLQSFLEDRTLILICMLLASFRIYLEIAGVNFAEFPLAKKFPAQGEKIHKYGLYISLGYVVLFAPEILLS